MSILVFYIVYRVQGGMSNVKVKERKYMYMDSCHTNSHFHGFAAWSHDCDIIIIIITII